MAKLEFCTYAVYHKQITYKWFKKNYFLPGGESKEHWVTSQVELTIYNKEIIYTYK